MYILCVWGLRWSEVSVPVTVLHVVKLLRWSLNGAADARVTTGPTWEKFKVWPRLVLVTLQAVVEAAVRLVVWFPRHPAEDTEIPALLPGLEDVELPDGDAGHGEPQPNQAVPHQSVREEAERPAVPDWLSEVLFDENTEILEVRTAPTVTTVCHHEPSRLALAQVGEVPTETEMERCYQAESQFMIKSNSTLTAGAVIAICYI